MAEFTIKSEEKETLSSSESLFTYLSDFNNFKHLLPEDKIENFTCTTDSCTFSIKGTTTLHIKQKEKVPFSRITFESEGLAKFNFTLHALFYKQPLSTKENCRVELEGSLNPFIKAMAEKPLSQLVNTMAERLSKLELQ